MVLNARTIARHARYRQEYKKTFCTSGSQCLHYGAAAWGVYKVLTFILPTVLLRGRLGRAIVVLPSVAVAAAVYAFFLVGLKAIDEEELRDMPMGNKADPYF